MNHGNQPPLGEKGTLQPTSCFDLSLWRLCKQLSLGEVGEAVTGFPGVALQLTTAALIWSTGRWPCGGSTTPIPPRSLVELGLAI